jgi:hypothetical protein
VAGQAYGVAEVMEDLVDEGVLQESGREDGSDGESGDGHNRKRLGVHAQIPNTIPGCKSFHDVTSGVLQRRKS